MNANDPTSAELLERYRDGDSRAADELHARYVTRLLALARSRLSKHLAARTDAEDIVQSAYRSFFLRARQGQFELRRSGDLWRLLARITLRKLYRQAERHQAARRSVDREQPHGESESSELNDADFVSREPTPEEAAALAEQLAQCMAQLNPLQRKILELRLQESTIDEIAAVVERGERTVRRNLEAIRRRLSSLLDESPP